MFGADGPGDDGGAAGADGAGNQAQKPQHVGDRPHRRCRGSRKLRQMARQICVIQPHRHVQHVFREDRQRQPKQFPCQWPVGYRSLLCNKCW